MKAISIKQPWANLILKNMKNIEIRSWKSNYRGGLLIHSSKKVDKIAQKRFENIECEPKGKIIGICNLIDVKQYKSLKSFIHDYNCHLNTIDQYTINCFGFLFAEPKKIKPLVVKGKLGIFNINLSKQDTEILE